MTTKEKIALGLIAVLLLSVLVLGGIVARSFIDANADRARLDAVLDNLSKVSKEQAAIREALDKKDDVRTKQETKDLTAIEVERAGMRTANQIADVLHRELGLHEAPRIEPKKDAQGKDLPDSPGSMVIDDPEDQRSLGNCALDRKACRTSLKAATERVSDRDQKIGSLEKELGETKGALDKANSAAKGGSGFRARVKRGLKTAACSAAGAGIGVGVGGAKGVAAGAIGSGVCSAIF